MVNERMENFSIIMDIGESMIGCGADVHTVEETLVQLGRSYGAVRMNVLVITAEIIASAVFPDEDEVTLSRRLLTDGGSNFAKLEALSSLCREAVACPIPCQELRRRYENIKNKSIPNWCLYVGGILSAGGFAIFFGGSILDAVIAAMFAALICVFIKYFKPIAPNVIIFNFITSLVVGFLICLTAAMFPFFNLNMVIVGVIMLLIPGVAMTNATRDLLSGDTVSGVMRFIESMLWALSLAIGFMIALWIETMIGMQHKALSSVTQWPLYIMIPATLVSSLGFAFFFNVQYRQIPIATIGGLLTWLVFDAIYRLDGNIFLPTVIASTIAAIYAELLAWKLKVPSSVFFIIAVIPLVPGRLLYFTMYTAVDSAWADCIVYAYQTLLFAAGIAVGIFLVASFMQIQKGIAKQVLLHSGHK